MVAIDVTLLPIFLFASLKTNSSDWKYGPEVIYDAKIDGTAPRLNETGNVYVYNTTMKLKCRPKNYTTLSCLLHEPRIRISLIESDGKHRVINDSATSKKKTEKDHTFEYNVDPDLSDDTQIYIASSSINGARLDVIRSLMDTLYVPSYWPKLQRGELNVMENSTLGMSCKTKYVASLINLRERDNTRDKKSFYEIKIKPNETVKEGQAIEIKKTRFLRECDMAVIMNKYKDGNEMNSKSWTNRITISKDNFTASAETEAILTKPGSTSRNVNARETITLHLEDFVPATRPLPKIDNPMSFGRAGTQVFHSFSAASYLLADDLFYRR